MTNEWTAGFIEWAGKELALPDKPSNITHADYHQYLEEQHDSLWAEWVRNGRSTRFNEQRTELAQELAAYWYAEIVRVAQAIRKGKKGEVEKAVIDGYTYRIHLDSRLSLNERPMTNFLLRLDRDQSEVGYCDKLIANEIVKNEFMPALALSTKYKASENTDMRFDLAFNPSRDKVSVFQRVQRVYRQPYGPKDPDWIKRSTHRIQDGTMPNWQNFQVIGNLFVWV
jgi:hypothetical protein